MLNFRNSNIFFIALLVLCVSIDVVYDLTFFIYLILFFLYSMVLFYGCYFISSNFFLPVTCSAKTTKKQIAITFDDGPAGNTRNILKVLREYEIPATFFCIGKRIGGMEQILQTLQEEGHIIANHSYSHHFWFDLFSSARMLTELKNTDEAIKKATGLSPKFFRPPYGVINPNLKKAILMGNYTPVGWSVRSLDTVIKDPEKLLKKVNKALKPGAVFLFHDTSNASVAILPAFIKQVKEQGFEIMGLDKLLNLKAYA